MAGETGDVEGMRERKEPPREHHHRSTGGESWDGQSCGTGVTELAVLGGAILAHLFGSRA